MNAKQYLNQFRPNFGVSVGATFVCTPCRATREQINSLLVHNQVEDLKEFERQRKTVIGIGPTWVISGFTNK